MKIICRKFKSNEKKRGLKILSKKSAAVFSAIAAALIMYFAMQQRPDALQSVFAVSNSNYSHIGSTINADEPLTVDDDLTDVFLDGEEIDSGVSATYDGKLDIPTNVRLDKIEFGSDFSKPLDSAKVTSLFDYRVNPVTGRYVFHTGIDLGAAQGANIYAMLGGRVVRAKYDSGYGYFVVLEHSNGIRTLYAHCSRLKVKAGETVEKGQVIALVGSTGNSTGPHLHLEFRKNNQRYDPEWVIGGIYN